MDQGETFPKNPGTFSRLYIATRLLASQILVARLRETRGAAVRNFGHKRPVRDELGRIIELKPSPVHAITLEKLGAAFGPDKKHRLIVTLAEGDLVILRPERTARPITVAAKDVYRFALMARANLANLEKARAAKARKAERLAARRIARTERRLFPRAKETRQPMPLPVASRRPDLPLKPLPTPAT